MHSDRRQQDYDDHFAALRKLDSLALMQRGRVARARAMRILLRLARRRLRAIASRIMSALVRRLRHPELARYDERMLRDMGITSYDVRTSAWRSRQRKRLARFNERDLTDIGISKCDVGTNIEIEKMFRRG